MARNPGDNTFAGELQRAKVAGNDYFNFAGKRYTVSEVEEAQTARQEELAQKQKEAEETSKQDTEEMQKSMQEAEQRRQQESQEFTESVRARQGGVQPVQGSSEQTMKLELVQPGQAVFGGQVYDNPEEVRQPRDAAPAGDAVNREVPWQGTIEETRAATAPISTVPDATTPVPEETTADAPANDSEPKTKRARR